MRISERGQITIPKKLRDRFGMSHNVEVELTPTRNGLLLRKRSAVESMFYLLEIRAGIR